MSFKPIDQKIDFIAMERRLLDFWDQEGIVEKYLVRNSGSKKIFSFLDGPITANNPMGVHHAWGRTYKDLWQRFFNMRGFRERFQNGFDNQGLWVEVEVEKELGFKDKKDIENYGVDKFVEKCKEHTLKFAKIQTEQSKRLGYFMDWDHSYYTMSDENNYMIWGFLKVCQEKGWLYKGRDTVPWCPRCGTAISQHEIGTEEYKEISHDSVYIEYPIKSRKNEFLLVWTTTPWTLPGNVAVAVDKEKEYAAAMGSVKGNTYYLLKGAAEKLGLKVIKILKGAELVGLKYESPFDNLPRVTRSLGEYEHIVIASDTKILPVNEEEGTGMIHLAPGAGTEDFHLGKKLGLPVIELIDEKANYLDDFGEFSGKNAKEHPEIILNYLKTINDGLYLFNIVSYTHRYPSCWRCKTELVWRVVDEWYISMDSLRQPMMAIAKKINWLPSWGLDRELDWLKNMQDWLISKKRYWGLALPIWECKKCGNFEVIGSKEELKEKAVEGWKEFEGCSPHRPWVDKVKIKCSKCGEVSSRIPDIGNPWLDAGIVPFSTLKYKTDKKYWQEWFPADFITEAFPGQYRNWFYSLIAMSTVLEDTNSFKTVLGHALVRDEKGEEMHKSKGNAIAFDEAAEKIGVDVMRWMYLSQNPEMDLNFGYHVADEMRRRFYLIFWNIYKFFIDYAVIDNWEPKTAKDEQVNVLDKWILSKLNQLVKSVSQNLEKYDAMNASRAIETFVVGDLSTWYVRRSRDRIGPTVLNNESKNDCYSTLYEVLTTLVKILAPFTPFLSEEIYKNLTGNESVHLTDWPEIKEDLINEDLEKKMQLVREIVEMGHAARKAEKIKVRQPLQSIKVAINKEKLEKELIQLIEEELNVKNVDWVKTEKAEIKINLETQLTPGLEAEGLARDLVRQIQEARREKGCALSEKIIVFLPDWPKEFEDYIKTKTLAQNLEKGPFGIECLKK